MLSHEVDFEIFGDDMQFVEIGLDPQESVIAEAGAMMYLTQGITFETKMGDGSEPDQGMWGKLKGAGKRVMTGESIFMTHFTNSGGGYERLAFAAPYPGKIIPVDLAEIGGRLICQKDAFLCAAMGTTVDRGRSVWWGGFHPAGPAGGREGVRARRRHHCREALAGGDAAGGHRVPRGPGADDRVLDREGREPEVDGVRR